MRDEHSPQMKEMSDAAMVRTLAAQAALIWPQEQALFTRYDVPLDGDILDVGCGTGDVTHRLADQYPSTRVTGVDIVEPHLAEARRRYVSYGDRLVFRHADAFDLPFEDERFDLTVCRHMLQSVPRQPAAIAELVRVTRAGGRLHLIAEDYGMVHFEPGDRDPDHFWHHGPVAFGDRIATDLRVGRRAYGYLKAAGLSGITLDYVIVDTIRCDRGPFIEMMRAWKDGFSESIAADTEFSLEDCRAHFDAMIATLEDEDRYAAWFVPVYSAIKS